MRSVLLRLVIAIPLLVLVSFSVFLMVSFTPGDPALILAGDNPTPQVVAEIRTDLGLDHPLLDRYVIWVGHALHGNLGTSFVTRQEVTQVIQGAAAATASLILVTIVVSLILGGVLGITAALRPRSFFNRVVTLVASIAMALPAIWVGMILVIFFAVRIRWFPAIGYFPISQGFGPWLRGLVLPGLALGALPTAEIALQLRNSMVDTLSRDYVVAARARGLLPISIVMKHALKNAVVPVMTVFGTRLAQLIGGTVTVETVFNISGIGSLAVRSVLSRDVPVLLGLVIMTTIVVLLINLAIDLLNAYVNPKVRA